MALGDKAAALALAQKAIRIAAGCVVEALFWTQSDVFTEIVEISILGNVERPIDNNADQADWPISADEAREWQTQQGGNEAGLRR